MLLIAAALLVADLSGLTLEASSGQRELLVGEPLKLTLRWKATKPVKDVAVEEADFLFQSLLLSVDDGTGARLYREYPHQVVERTLVARSFAEGDEEVVNLVFFRGGYVEGPTGAAHDRLLFPYGGVYSVTALYVHGGARSTVAANTLRFKVGEPRGADREVLDELQKDPTLISVDGTADSQTLARRLMAEHPDSRYLRLARLERFRQQASDLENERDPDTGESVYPLGKEGLARFRRQHFRRMAETMLADDDWGPFEEEALALASLYANAAGEKEISERARKDLFARYPRSATVKRIKEEEAEPADVEDQPPAPKVSPTPKQ